MAGDLSRAEVMRIIERRVRQNTYLDQHGYMQMGLGLSGVSEAADEILTLARSAPSEEELALRAAALKVGEAEAKREEFGDTVALHLAENELNQAARAFARTVEKTNA